MLIFVGDEKLLALHLINQIQESVNLLVVNLLPSFLGGQPLSRHLVNPVDIDGPVGDLLALTDGRGNRGSGNGLAFNFGKKLLLELFVDLRGLRWELYRD